MEEQAWVNQEWQPKLIETGIKYMAIIHPQNVIAKISMTQIISQIPGADVTVYNCASLEEARTWMKQQVFGAASRSGMGAHNMVPPYQSGRVEVLGDGTSEKRSWSIKYGARDQNQCREGDRGTDVSRS